MSYSSKGLLIDRFKDYISNFKPYKCDSCKYWCNCSNFMGYRKIWFCDTYNNEENIV